MAEQYVRLVQDLYESSMTVVMRALGMMDGFKVEEGLNQGLALSPFLLVMIIDKLIDEVRQEYTV